ncbi:MFS transporter [Aurantiacibacter zhengii]|uniref:MFS transporter n=1 Tax=Aurantiacibacter zhengii TaxID=2307003 RepID=A0A418NUY8_9SPHN|nr:MFS transporter [Aurantiacibacter zhengii]RIV87740.1 MFS transporter [Aurantiacibacter zhengii]
MSKIEVGSARRAVADDMSERRKTTAFLTVLTALVLEVADSTIVNTALPAIRDGLLASPAAMQWIVAGYLLSLGSLLLLGGRLGDAFGHSRVFLVGTAGFVAASVFCGLAQSPGQLVAARMVQGAAGAVMAPQTMAIVQILYTPLERVTKLAYFGVIVGLAAIMGPIIGGILIEWDLFGLGWRLVFLVNLPIGLCAILVGWFVLPQREPGADLRIDPAGALIFAAGFGGLLFALITGAETSWSAGLILLLALSITVVVFGWFRAGARRSEGRPAIIEPALFGIGTFRWGVLSAFCFSSASIGFLLILSVSLQQGLGLSPLETALVHIPFSGGVMLGIGLLVPKLLPRIGKALPLAGGAAMIAGTFLATRAIMDGNGGGLILLSCLALAGVGMGAMSGPLGPIVVAEVDRVNAGTASATLRTAQQIGGALGIAIIGAVYFSAPGEEAVARLAGLGPAGFAIAAALALALLSVTRLPSDLFGQNRNSGR